MGRILYSLLGGCVGPEKMVSPRSLASACFSLEGGADNLATAIRGGSSRLSKGALLVSGI